MLLENLILYSLAAVRALICTELEAAGMTHDERKAIQSRRGVCVSVLIILIPCM